MPYQHFTDGFALSSLSGSHQFREYMLCEHSVPVFDTHLAIVALFSVKESRTGYNHTSTT